jgi:pimeloyl-ACP methyl ester carboxylesterase
MLTKAAIVILVILAEGTLSYIHPRGHREIAVRIRAATDFILKSDTKTTTEVTKPVTVSITQDDANPTHTTDFSIVADKTPLLFLPGLDGIENYSSRSIDNLNVAYDVWRMTVSGDDRSSFMEIASVVLQKLDAFDRPAIIVGESFGGLLATYIALRAKKGSISKLVLVNPATSFHRTPWPLLAPVIANSGVAFPFLGMATLLSSISDVSQIQRVGQKMIASITSTETAMNAFNELIEFGRLNTENISPETLNWRISKWFGVGASLMNEKYSQIRTPTLILIGKNDRLLPSRSEGKRLLKEMTSSTKVELKEYDIGHALLEDGFVDIASEILKLSDVKDPLDCAFPTQEDMVDVETNFGPFLNAMSPVFLTRGKDGMLQRGVKSLPTGINGRPVLLVGNHQLYGADCAQIIREFINNKGTLVRGLAHPMVFNDRDSNPLMAPTLKKFGAVEVSATAIFGVSQVF